ncbi:MAG: GNAT family N-acetyltransferase [Propionibacteriaceae bacterium]|jgi:GNAT superfamily N-acetyltransferase|nr:GNAT family N-acetyltransferase [Propionibacteriaceae bacterium]
MTYSLVEIPREATPDSADGWMFHQSAGVIAAALRASIGDDESALNAAELWALGRETPGGFGCQAVILDGAAPGRVVAFAEVDLPMKDNLISAHLHSWVHPDHWRRGLGTRLEAWQLGIAEEFQRTTLITWVAAREPHDDEASITAPEGGSFAADLPAWGFAQKHCWMVEQVERTSRLDLPVDQGLLDSLRAKVARASSGYEVLSHVGPIPSDWVDGLAELHEVMSVDIPTAGLDFTPEKWDAERVLSEYEMIRNMNREMVLVVAREISSGRLVGFSDLAVQRDSGDGKGFQWNTLVRRQHNGHRLGLALKLASTEAIMAETPWITRIYTDNASENGAMLAINHAIGYQLANPTVAFQKRL